MISPSSRARALAMALALAGLIPAAGLGDDHPTPVPAPAAPRAGAPTDLDLADMLRARALMMGGGGPVSSNDPKKYRDFNDVTQGAQRHEGLFTLYQKDDHLFAEIRPFQFDQPLYATATIARGLARAGEPLDDTVVMFHRAGDRVQLIARNFYFKAPFGSPTEKAVRQNYTDSVLMALPIVSLNPGGGMSVLIDLSDVFFTDFAKVGLGFLDRNRTNWFKVKAFPNNLELEVQATFAGSRASTADGVSDGRGVTLVIHYSLLRLPDPMYRPRQADDRIGHFVNAVKDFGSTDPDTSFVRYISRWRLEKADPRSKLSPPKRQIVWWVEDTVPVEYRPYVEAGILEWNRAFEKVGIRNAMAVRWQSERDEFDPEDANYCTIRWITTNRTYAMSCFRANPLTGEIMDGDVIFDASWVKAWKKQYAFLTGALPAAIDGHALDADPAPLAVGEVISPILADRRGFGSFAPGRAGAQGADGLAVVPSDWGPLQQRLQKRLTGKAQLACQFTTGMQAELSLAAIAFAEVDVPTVPPGAAAAAVEARLPEEFIGQLIKEVVMHEVGHSLGLEHNFKASTMLSAEEVNDPGVTRVKGQSGSVMDYNPINLAPKGQKQGDYVTQTLGPYDYWAIEYAYKEVMGDEAAELKRIASRAAEPDLTFGGHIDMILNNDPQVNTYDLGSDPCRFAKDRLVLVDSLLKDLDAKVVKDGESWARARVAFASLLRQYGNAATLASAYVGGQSVHRDHKGDKGARDPIVPTAGAKQREALGVVVDYVLSDKPFKFSPALLRRQASEKWYHWGAMPEGSDITLHDKILGIQKIALAQCLDADTLSRLQDQELQADPGSNPLKVGEVFRALTDGIFAELKPADPNAKDKPAAVAVSTIRRNLQREYLKRLSTMVLGKKAPSPGGGFLFIVFSGGGDVPPDARALARLHLREIQARIARAIDAPGSSVDDTTRAHLEECQQRIGKVLNAGLDANEP